ncbi:MAG TPA: LysR family transcriptional regulator [Kofleriaceae bacterium]|jgi:DNA-binding transcriptional LysR family regulator
MDTPNLDPAALSALLAVIDTGSFTAAAQKLRLSQPAISLAVKRLEERVGVSLLVRTRKRIVASRPGELLASGARVALEAITNSVAQIANERVEPAGRVVIGCHESLAAYSLPSFMARFLREYPRIELRLWNGRSAEVEQELVAGRVDLALIVNPNAHPDLVIVPVFDDSVELVHCIARRRREEPATVLASVPLIYVPELVQSQHLLAQLHGKRIATPRLLPCSSLELVKSLVIDEVGVGVLPRRVAEHNLKKKLLTLSPPLPLYRDRVALVRRFDIPQTAAIRVVLDELGAHCRVLRST